MEMVVTSLVLLLGALLPPVLIYSAVRYLKLRNILVMVVIVSLVTMGIQFGVQAWLQSTNLIPSSTFAWH